MRVIEGRVRRVRVLLPADVQGAAFAERVCALPAWPGRSQSVRGFECHHVPELCGRRARPFEGGYLFYTHAYLLIYLLGPHIVDILRL